MDIDKVIIHNYSVNRLQRVCGPVCHVAHRQPYARETLKGLCVVMYPAYVYIHHDFKEAVCWVLDHVSPNRFLPLHSQSNKFLAIPSPRIMVTCQLEEALSSAGVATCIIFMYGMKARLTICHSLTMSWRTTTFIHHLSSTWT